MEAVNRKRNLDEILSAAERIVKAKEEELQEDLFGNSASDKVLNDIKEILDSAAEENHDSQKAYDLYYGIIKKLVLNTMPKSEVRDLIQLLTCNLLTGVELLRKGEKRGQDSRQQSINRFDEVANIIMDWSEHPYDPLRLAQSILDECIKRGISPKERTLYDFLKRK